MDNSLVESTTAALVEKVLISGDLSTLNETQRLDYYSAVCRSVGLNPLTKPFEYIRLNGKLVLYAKRDATDQLRKVNKVSVTITSREKIDDLYIVTARAIDSTGREDESTGAVYVSKLSGEPLANAMMKAETKAKRRVTLSICGLGMLDETEVESISYAAREFQKPNYSPLSGATRPTLPVTAKESSNSTSESVVPSTKPESGGDLSDAQIKRLFAIAHSNGWDNNTLKDYLKTRYNITSTKDLKRVQYDELCSFIEASGNTKRPPNLAPTFDDTSYPFPDSEFDGARI